MKSLIQKIGYLVKSSATSQKKPKTSLEDLEDGVVHRKLLHEDYFCHHAVISYGEKRYQLTPDYKKEDF